MNPDVLHSELKRIAANYRWSWVRTTRELLESLPGAGPHIHPVVAVSRLDQAQLESLASDASFVARVETETPLLEQAIVPTIAYCSPEFGLSALFPQYAGGLGVLAGDHLKSASDLGAPLAGVGLFYREGVFRQEIEESRQIERYDAVSPESVGAADTGIVVEVPFPGRQVLAKVWRVEVGRIPLLLLDTDVDDNTADDRRITDRLYTGSREHRLDQEMVLGVGGARALEAMGWDIDLHHLNEGHAGFIVLELLDRACREADFEEARSRVRGSLVFTTHTPVPAGIDRFDSDLTLPYLEHWARSWNVPVESVWELGEDPEDEGVFNMAALCLRSARTANGVSELHGEVSRKLFAGIGIGDDITHVTNGVHARTWTGTPIQTLFDDTLGPGWANGDQEAWDRASQVSDSQLTEARRRCSELLVDLIRQRTGDIVDPDALIIGFARRFAPYKRATLFLRRPDLTEAILSNDDRPVHLVFAGKAHPSDQTGKDLIADVIAAKTTDAVNGRLTFIPDYEMDIGLALVQGTDIWLNNPIRPREASGTSGEKAALNGSLNCSILDGWWAEMYDGYNGWEIPLSPAADPETRDDEEATAMLETIREIADEYHGSRPLFSGRIRHAWSTLGPRVTSARMLRDYEDRIYRKG